MADSAVVAIGIPGWVDVMSKDMEASRRFYSQLFGWTPNTAPDDRFGGYTTFTLEGRPVAAVAPAMEGAPPAWNTYVLVKDAAATTESVRAAGGTVLVEPMQVAEFGTMAVFLDPTGAAISVWQPDQHKGAEVVNQPGSLTWNELQTRDVEKAEPFYKAVFGWDSKTSVGSMPYTEFTVDGRSIAGMMTMPGEIPAQVPANWLTYFAVDDCDATVARVRELGGSVMMEPMDVEPGRFAVVADTDGAVFAVIKSK